MLARMTTSPALEVEELRRFARQAGFAWSDAEPEEIRSAVTATLRAGE
jgi:hypothetical protein